MVKRTFICKASIACCNQSASGYTIYCTTELVCDKQDRQTPIRDNTEYHYTFNCNARTALCNYKSTVIGTFPMCTFPHDCINKGALR